MSVITPELDEELLSMMLGDTLGTGSYRVTRLFLPDTRYVVKLQCEDYRFDNVKEWQLYEAAKGTALEKWLAPCKSISRSGRVLIQRRTEPLPLHLRPDKVPSVLTDIKLENWGLLDGRPVCHDYANNLLGTYLRLKKASWHSPPYKGWAV